MVLNLVGKTAPLKIAENIMAHKAFLKAVGSRLLD